MNLKEKHWIASSEHVSLRLDQFLSQCDPELSRNEARRQIAAGNIWINGRRCRKMSRSIYKGDRVTLRPTSLEQTDDSSHPDGPEGADLSTSPSAAPPRRGRHGDTSYDDSVFGPPPTFLYQDRHMAIINKPSGVPIEPTPKEDLRTCLRQLEAWQRYRGVHPKKLYVTPAHRLDSGASGAVAFALSKTAARLLSEQFVKRTAKRIYWAVVVGCPEPAEGILRDHMDHTGPGLKRSVVAPPRGKMSITEYRVIECFGEASLVEISLQTGRTHQIRVHFAHIGHPLVGDWMYCTPEKASLCPPSDRLLLHARKLTIKHPNGTEIAVEAPLDERFSAYLDALRESPAEE